MCIASRAELLPGWGSGSFSAFQLGVTNVASGLDKLLKGEAFNGHNLGSGNQWHQGR
jgi:hypothetical protein